MPVSHTELADRLAGDGLDRATVFRNLVSLTEAGILAKSQLGAVWRYELPSPDGDAHARHPHFVCTDCGDVACLPDKAVKVQTLPAKSQVAEIQVRGRCSSCV
jgi:Fur family ferric uptake transcriptional regulator